MLHDESGDLVPLGGEGHQHALVRGGARLGPLDDRQPEAVEQELAELLHGAQVHLLAGDLEDLLADEIDVAPQLPGEVVEELDVDPDPGALHVDEHRQQRHLHALEEMEHLVGSEILLQHPGQAQRVVGLFGHGGSHVLRVPFRGLQIGPAYLHAAAGERVAEALQREQVQVLLPLPRIQAVGGERDVKA